MVSATLFPSPFPAHFQRFDSKPTIRGERHYPAHRFPCKQIENNSKVCPASSHPDISHISTPHRVWRCHCELALEVIRDGYMLLTTAFISVRGLLTAYQPLFFHESAGKPATHPEASQYCHCGDTFCPGRTMADVVQLLKTWLCNTVLLPSGLSGRLFQYL